VLVEIPDQLMSDPDLVLAWIYLNRLLRGRGSLRISFRELAATLPLTHSRSRHQASAARWRRLVLRLAELGLVKAERSTGGTWLSIRGEE